jgi:hypothetical protein
MEMKRRVRDGPDVEEKGEEKEREESGRHAARGSQRRLHATLPLSLSLSPSLSPCLLPPPFSSLSSPGCPVSNLAPFNPHRYRNLTPSS